MTKGASVGAAELRIDAASSTPPYLQLVEQVVRGIRSGEVPAGTRLPTVRALSQELSIATNTVAKAYRMLEAEGHVATRGRNGTTTLGTEAHDGLGAFAQALAREAQGRGLSFEETTGLLRQVW